MRYRKTEHQHIRHAIAVAALIFAFAPGMTEAQTKVKAGFNMFSPEQDVEIGRQSAAQAEQQLPIVRDRSVEAFVNDIGERLAAQAPGPKFDYRFQVVNASDLNAFALPGGYIYLNRGIIESAKTEGEVAGVLAHEIAHVALRHGTHNASKAYMTQAGIGILGGILGGRVGGNTAQIINAVGGLGLNALFLKYSREAETDADIIGAQILARAGYNPVDMINFFRTLERADKTKKTTWLSSHPAPPQRISRIEKEAKLLQVAPATTGGTQQLARVQSTLRGLGSARTTEQIARMNQQPDRSVSGSRRGSTQGVTVSTPSTQTRIYTDSGRLFQVSYPADWSAYQGSGNGVTLLPEGGAGDLNGQTEIIYGAVINHYEPLGNVRYGNQTAVTLEEGTEDLIRQIQQSGPHLKVVRGSTKAFRLAGGRGLGATLSGVNPNTRIRERITVVTRQLSDGHLLYMLFITPDQDATRFNTALNSMVSSLRVDTQIRH